MWCPKDKDLSLAGQTEFCRTGKYGQYADKLSKLDLLAPAKHVYLVFAQFHPFLYLQILPKKSLSACPSHLVILLKAGFHMSPARVYLYFTPFETLYI